MRDGVPGHPLHSGHRPAAAWLFLLVALTLGYAAARRASTFLSITFAPKALPPVSPCRAAAPTATPRPLPPVAAISLPPGALEDDLYRRAAGQLADALAERTGPRPAIVEGGERLPAGRIIVVGGPGRNPLAPEEPPSLPDPDGFALRPATTGTNRSWRCWAAVAPQRPAPTEPVPVLEIIGTITDAETGEPVPANVQVGNVYITQVDRFRVLLPAGGTITISVTAPGYRRWSVGLTPHIQRSKRLEIPIQLQTQSPVGDPACCRTFSSLTPTHQAQPSEPATSPPQCRDTPASAPAHSPVPPYPQQSLMRWFS